MIDQWFYATAEIMLCVCWQHRKTSIDDFHFGRHKLKQLPAQMPIIMRQRFEPSTSKLYIKLSYHDCIGQNKNTHSVLLHGFRRWFTEFRRKSVEYKGFIIFLNE